MMVYSVIITAILAACLVCLGYEHSAKIKAQDEAAELERDLFDEQEKVRGYQIEKANRDGVEAGRTSDRIYRQFLEQFDAHEQVTVILQREDAKYYAGKH